MKNKRILFLINTLEGGGAEKVLVNLVNGLSCYGFDITISSLWQGCNTRDVSSKVKLRSVLKGRPNFITGYFIRAFQKILPERMISRIMARGKFDMKVAYLEGFPTKILSADTDKCSKIAFVHSDFSKGYTLQKVYKTINDCLEQYGRYDKVAFVSRTALTGFESMIGKLANAEVLYNVMDVEAIKVLSNEECPNPFNMPNSLRLIAVGRLSAPKSFDRLINVISRLNNEGRKVELAILGDGCLYNSLIEQCQQLNCKNITFLGYQTNPYKYFRYADMMVCSSLYEGYSTTATEAMLLKLPVITTDCSGMDEILECGKYGIITPNSEQGLYEGLTSVLGNPKMLDSLRERMSEKSRKMLQNENLKQNIDFFNKFLNA